MALVEDPSEAVLDRWGIEDLPTWLVLRAETDDEAGCRPGAGPGEPARLDLDGLPAPVPGGQPSTGDTEHAPASSEGLSGAWSVLSRHAGALPKHAVDGMLDDVLLIGAPLRPMTPAAL